MRNQPPDWFMRLFWVIIGTSLLALLVWEAVSTLNWSHIVVLGVGITVGIILGLKE